MNDSRYTSTHAAIVRLLTALGVDQKDPNYKETPRRVATWLLTKFPLEPDQEVERQLLAKKAFPSNYDGLVAQVGIKVYGLCPHHFLPVAYTVAIGYLPQGKTIGLSKLARLAELELGVAITQEDGTSKLADSLKVMLSALDVAVVVHGVHNCMVVRGVKQQSTFTQTAEMYGKFRLDAGGLKSEFLALVRNGGR